MSLSWLRTNWFNLLLAGLLLAVAVLKYRDPIVHTDGTDLAVPYAGARAWLLGSNPYDQVVLENVFHAAGGDSFSGFDTRYLPPVYPPVSLVLLSPLGQLTWSQAKHAWELIAVVLLTLTILALIDLAQIPWISFRSAIFIVFCIVFTPLRSAFTLGQSALLVACLVVLTIWAFRHGFAAVAGLLLAAAVCLKPHDALFILIGFILMRSWRLLAWTFAGITVIALIALVRPPFSALGYIPDWLRWVREAAAPGAVNDPDTGGARFQMIHLPVVLFTFMNSRAAVALVTYFVSGMLGLILGIRIFRDHSNRNDSLNILAFSALAAFTLVPFFHRFADASLLILPLAWGISQLGAQNQTRGRITILLLLPFLLQPNEVSKRLVSRGVISASTNSTWWYNCFGRASLVWVTLALSIWLISLVACTKTSSAS